MSRERVEPVVPEGYEPVAWYTFPSQHGVWRPSRVHLRLDDESYRGVLCGSRRARYAGPSSRDCMHEHMQDAGQCVRCLKIAGGRGAV